jgi:hypothetical protein
MLTPAGQHGEHPLKNNLTLTITSLLSILLLTFHLSDDIVRGFEKGGLMNLTAIPICVLWLYATVVLAGRRSGYIIILLGSLLALGVPYLHARGVGMVGGRIANSGGKFFWVWTLLAIGITGLFSLILCVRGLWGLSWRRPR